MCKICNRILQVNNLAKSKLQYDVKTKYRLISRKFSCMTLFHPSVRLTNQKPRAFVYIRSINRWNGSISVRLLFLFCSRVFISRSYENHSICLWLLSVLLLLLLFFYIRVGIDKVEGMQKLTLFWSCSL